MILLDANVLLYAYDDAAPQHSRVRSWLEERLTGSEDVAIPWLTLWAFVRISTNLRLSERPLNPEAAFRIVESLIAHPRVIIVEPSPRHAQILEQMVRDGQATGPRVTDAALAALAFEHGARVASTDRDFSRFAGLRWVNPLETR